MNKKVNIASIKPNDENPRFITDAKFKKLIKSIKSFPEMLEARPLVVDENMMVLGGNMRLKALKSAGIFEVPINQVLGWTEEQKKEFIVKDNVGFGEWDWDILANQYDQEELVEWGMDLPEFPTEEVLEAEEDDYEEPDEMQVDVVLGDLIEIGEHRLLCGDSTDSDQVKKLMDGKKADVSHNDPPYGMKKENEGVLNDNLNFKNLLDFNKKWIPLQFSYLKENGSFYCWGIDEPLMDIYSEILKPFIKKQKIRDKGNGQGQNSDNTRSYAIADEKCLFVMCGVQGFNNNTDNYFDKWEPIRIYLEKEIKKLNESDKTIAIALGYKDGRTVNHWWSKSQWTFPTEKNYNDLKKYSKTKKIEGFKKEYEGFKKEYEELKKEYEELKKEYYGTRAYFDNVHDNFNNVWHFDRHIRQGDEGNHATPKPLLLCQRAIKSSCPIKGLVLDLFLGSGSTMVASHQLNRICYGMELDPKYCQVIIDRMQKLDPSLKIKINGKEYKNQ
jgi:DNA modification methylase